MHDMEERKKRKRRSYNCELCKLLKIKCDLQIPCLSCVKFNRVEKCLRNPPRPPSKDELYEISKRRQRFMQKKKNEGDQKTEIPKNIKQERVDNQYSLFPISQSPFQETQPINQPVNQPINQPLNQPINHQPLNQVLNQPPLNQPLNQPLHQPLHHIQSPPIQSPHIESPFSISPHISPHIQSPYNHLQSPHNLSPNVRGQGNDYQDNNLMARGNIFPTLMYSYWKDTDIDRNMSEAHLTHPQNIQIPHFTTIQNMIPQNNIQNGTNLINTNILNTNIPNNTNILNNLNSTVPLQNSPQSSISGLTSRLPFIWENTAAPIVPDVSKMSVILPGPILAEEHRQDEHPKVSISSEEIDQITLHAPSFDQMKKFLDIYKRVENEHIVVLLPYDNILSDVKKALHGLQLGSTQLSVNEVRMLSLAYAMFSVGLLLLSSNKTDDISNMDETIQRWVSLSKSLRVKVMHYEKLADAIFLIQWYFVVKCLYTFQMRMVDNFLEYDSLLNYVVMNRKFMDMISESLLERQAESLSESSSERTDQHLPLVGVQSSNSSPLHNLSPNIHCYTPGTCIHTEAVYSGKKEGNQKQKHNGKHIENLKHEADSNLHYCPNGFNSETFESTSCEECMKNKDVSLISNNSKSTPSFIYPTSGDFKVIARHWVQLRLVELQFQFFPCQGMLRALRQMKDTLTPNRELLEAVYGKNYSEVSDPLQMFQVLLWGLYYQRTQTRHNPRSLIYLYLQLYADVAALVAELDIVDWTSGFVKGRDVAEESVAGSQSLNLLVENQTVLWIFVRWLSFLRLEHGYFPTLRYMSYYTTMMNMFNYFLTASSSCPDLMKILGRGYSFTFLYLFYASAVYQGIFMVLLHSFSRGTETYAIDLRRLFDEIYEKYCRAVSILSSICVNPLFERITALAGAFPGFLQQMERKESAKDALAALTAYISPDDNDLLIKICFGLQDTLERYAEVVWDGFVQLRTNKKLLISKDTVVDESFMEGLRGEFRGMKYDKKTVDEYMEAVVDVARGWDGKSQENDIKVEI